MRYSERWITATRTSSESETGDEQLQSGQWKLQVQLQIAKNEISVLTDKLEQQELSKQFLEQSLNDAGEKIKQLMTETGLAYSETENLKKEVLQGKERIKQFLFSSILIILSSNKKLPLEFVLSAISKSNSSSNQRLSTS